MRKHQKEESDDELRDLKEISKKNAESYVRYLMEGKVKLPQEKKVAVTKEVAGNVDHQQALKIYDDPRVQSKNLEIMI